MRLDGAADALPGAEVGPEGDLRVHSWSHQHRRRGSGESRRSTVTRKGREGAARIFSLGGSLRGRKEGGGAGRLDGRDSIGGRVGETEEKWRARLGSEGSGAGSAA